MKNQLLLTLFFLTGFITSAQTLLRGTILDETSKQPIANAKIGVTKQGVGVLSDVNGKFTYRKYDQTLDTQSTLRISADGYTSLTLNIDQIRAIYNLPAKLMMTKTAETTADKEKVVSVFWDVSEGMLGRDEEKELNFLQNYLSALGKVKVNFVVFNHKIISWKKEDVVDGDISRFRESVKNLGYSGPADYSLVQMDGATEVMLFSNGNITFGELDVRQDVPVVIATTQDRYRDDDYLTQVAQYTSGSYVALDKVDVVLQRVPSTMVTQNDISKPITLQGIVTSEDQLVEDAKVLVKGTFNEVSTDVNGQFKISAREGDVLVVSSLGMFTREVPVRTGTPLLVDLLPKNNVLDEVIITAQKEKFVVNNKVVNGQRISGAPGGITGRGYFYITDKDIEPNGRDLLQLIREKFKGVWISTDSQGNTVFKIRGKSYLFIINGGPWRGGGPPLHILDKDITSIIVKDDPQELGIKYGIIDPRQGRWVIVTTKNDSELQKQYRYDAKIKGNDYSEIVAAHDELLLSKNDVSGKVTSLGKPIQGASILLKGSFQEVISNADGSFNIDALPGETLVVNYLGMFPKEVDIPNTMELTVDLIPKNDVLDEVVLNGTKEEILVSGKKITGNTHPSIPGGFTALGDFYITAKDIKPNGLTLERVVRDNFKGAILKHTPYGEILTIKGRTPGYVVDGFALNPEEPLPFYISDIEIESIIVKDSPNLTSRYSITPVSGLNIIITTKRGAGTAQKTGEQLLAKNNEYTEETAIANNAIISPKTNSITGTVTSFGKPLQGVTLTRKGSFEEFKTDANGTFKIPATTDDVFAVTFLGMYPKTFAVENNTSNYTINLLPTNDVLDEVTLVADKKYEAPDYIGPIAELGKYKLNKRSYDVITLTKKDVNFEGSNNAVRALDGKIASLVVTGPPFQEQISIRGATPHIIIDGMISDIQIFQNLPGQLIKSVSIKKNIQGSVEGLQGPVVFVDTILNENNLKSKKGSALIQDNIYDETTSNLLSKNKITKQYTSTKNNTVRGIVRAEGRPLQGASVLLKGTLTETYTDDRGVFAIDAPAGETLVFSYLGMFPKELVINPRESNYTVNLTPKNNALDEILVQGSRRVDNTIATGFGEEKEDKLGYAVAEIKKESFNTGATTLRDLITGRFSGVTVQYNAYEGASYRMRGTGSINDDVPPIWVVNGTPYQQEPTFLDVQQIASISALKGLKAVNKYGTLARGGAFVITTIDYDTATDNAKKPQNGLITGNNYQEETIAANQAENEPEYITRLREIAAPKEQFEAYRQMARTQELSLEFYSDVARYFQKTNLDNADLVRADLAYIARNNTKALRTLAYLYEEAEDVQKMLQTYERVLTIAPQEAQSYRDVAHGYVANKQYNKALELYRNMLAERVPGVNFQGIEPVLRTELSRLVQLYKDKIEYKRLPNEWLRADFKRDVRMVIEWSDRNVPFEFQFVNPDKKFFKWMHTLEDNRERLEEERSQGFQIEEFIIDDAPAGEWIINVQYLGEEGDFALPPFLKYTLYRNYGTPEETKQMRVIKLFKQTDKVTLGKITL